MARVQEEFYTLGTALEAYAIDTNSYPACFWYPATLPWRDPFEIADNPYLQSGYQYKDYNSMRLMWNVYGTGGDWIFLTVAEKRGNPAWILESRGPDSIWAWDVQWMTGWTWVDVTVDYDSSNGTTSYGEVGRCCSSTAGTIVPHFDPPGKF